MSLYFKPALASLGQDLVNAAREKSLEIKRELTYLEVSTGICGRNRISTAMPGKITDCYVLRIIGLKDEYEKLCAKYNTEGFIDNKILIPQLIVPDISYRDKLYKNILMSNVKLLDFRFEISPISKLEIGLPINQHQTFVEVRQTDFHCEFYCDSIQDCEGHIL